MKTIDFENLTGRDIEGGEKKLTLDKESRRKFANMVYFGTNDQGDLPIGAKLYESPVLELEGEDIERFRGIMEKFGKKFFTAVAQIAIEDALKTEE